MGRFFSSFPLPFYFHSSILSVRKEEEWIDTDVGDALFHRFLVDDAVLVSCNKWRRARGDPELTMQEINPDGTGPPSLPQ